MFVHFVVSVVDSHARKSVGHSVKHGMQLAAGDSGLVGGD